MIIRDQTSQKKKVENSTKLICPGLSFHTVLYTPLANCSPTSVALFFCFFLAAESLGSLCPCYCGLCLGSFVVLFLHISLSVSLNGIINLVVANRRTARVPGLFNPPKPARSYSIIPQHYSGSCYTPLASIPLCNVLYSLIM